MKKYGELCKIDSLGRILVPSKLRKEFQLHPDDILELFVDTDAIILKKYIPACIFCASQENVKEIKGRNICNNCLKEIASLNEG